MAPQQFKWAEPRGGSSSRCVINRTPMYCALFPNSDSAAQSSVAKIKGKQISFYSAHHGHLANNKLIYKRRVTKVIAQNLRLTRPPTNREQLLIRLYIGGSMND